MSIINPTPAGPWVSPTRDPFNLKPQGNIFEALEKVVDQKIEQRLAGRTDNKFDGIADHAMVLELIARGFAVFKPVVNE